ncbi:MAG: HAMP domain-containing sensor histidine kinase, partial [Oscillospiraceae bacterium]
MGRLKINRINRVPLLIGLALVGLGIAMPELLTVHTINIYPTLERGIYEEEKLYVLLAALKLVGLNAARSFPHYLGAFFIAESIEVTRDQRRMAISIVVVCAVIPSVYLLIDRIYGIHYDFGVPAFLMIAMLMILGKINFNFVNLIKKALMVALLVIAFQFLDVMPALRHLPFGRGETSYDIKLTSSFLNADGFLQGMATMFFMLFLFIAVLLMMLIMDENNIKKISELKEQNEHILMETRMRILENRTYMELQHLVHDLKSPLTSMQALVGVVTFSCEHDNRVRDVDYLKKIERSIERMSGMISEILYEDRRTVLSTQEILTGLLSQISISEYAGLVRTQNDVPEQCVAVNKIRFSRALINLLENSFYAVDKQCGLIELSIDGIVREDRPLIRFSVRDNGKGIPRELLDSIWEKGFSTRSSHGLGLSFVEKVIKSNDGEISIDSTEGEGTLA